MNKKKDAMVFNKGNRWAVKTTTDHREWLVSLIRRQKPLNAAASLRRTIPAISLSKVGTERSAKSTLMGRTHIFHADSAIEC